MPRTCSSRARSTSWSSSRSATTTRAAAACGVTSRRCARSTAWTAGFCRRRCSRRGWTGARSRTRRSPVSKNWSRTGTCRAGYGGEAPMNPVQLFTQGTALAIVAGVATGLGLGLIVAGLIGWPSKPKDPDGKSSADALRKLGQRGIIALGAGLIVGLLSQWPVLGIGAVVLVLFWDQLFGGAASEKLAMRQVEALAMWTESPRDTIGGAVGLGQAVP